MDGGVDGVDGGDCFGGGGGVGDGHLISVFNKTNDFLWGGDGAGGGGDGGENRLGDGDGGEGDGGGGEGSGGEGDGGVEGGGGEGDGENT